MSPNKVKMPEQDPNVRNKNFEEVSLGYTKEQAMEEATRCLNCKKPFCMDGCPVGVPIPEFIHHVAEGEFEEAYQTITRENALPAICGRVCPQENQCEGKCVRGIKTESVGIGRLERFVADYHREHGKPAELKIEKNGKKVAVIGSGPAGITCAGELAKKGYDVTVFEALHKTGGVLSYGIPEFRLPKKLVQSEVDGVAALGVDFETNVVVGRSITIDELQEQGYQGIFVGSGAGLPRFQGIPGENLNGVYAANEFLTRVNLMKGYQFPDHPTPVKVTDTVCVIGAGNVAMDAARTAKRLGAKNVYIVYRRGPEEVPARAEEVHHAKEEGIIFKLLTNPVKIEGEDGWVKSMECVEMELGEPDASGRRRPIAKEGSNFTIETGTVIVAIGQSPNPLIRHTTPGLDCQSWGGIIVDEDSMKTSKDGVYAGGDVVTGAATVILAMGAGKKAAQAIDEALKNKWEYYVNQVYEMDQFVGDLIKAVEARKEPSVVVFYGDHLPTMGLKAEDLKSRYLYNTNYVIWDNVGLQKQDKNIPAYQLMSEILNRLDIHSGTVFNYHQQRKGTKNYLSDLELLQYDILYGKQYVYNNHPPISEGHMVMGIRDVSLSSIVPQLSSGYSLYGENFTKYSRVYVNGEKQKSSFLNNTRINLSETELQDGDVIQVGQVGSSDTIFRMSDKYIYQNGQLVKQEGTATDKNKSWVDQEYDVK